MNRPPASAPNGNPDAPGEVVSLRTATGLWVRLGLLSFGGPAGQIALMQRWLVDEKRWIGQRQFLDALNFCMLLPGPEAQQLATYVGWKMHGVRGGLVAGALFIVPGAVVVMTLSVLYLTLGALPVVQGLFEGLKPAVIVIVLQALIKISAHSLRGATSASIAGGAFVAMFALNLPFPLVIAAAALTGALLSIRTGVAPADRIGAMHTVDTRRILRTLVVCALFWLAPTAMLSAFLDGGSVYSDIAVFFSKMAVVTFGGAYAVLGYVSQEAVTTYGWLAPGEMIDGLAMAETTPGPLILVTQFVGFAAAFRNPGDLPPLAAGILGGALTTWVTFAPCFLWIFVGAPLMERISKRPRLRAALQGVSAAVVGVILNLALWFALHVLFTDVRTYEFAGLSVIRPALASFSVWPAALTVLALVAAFRFKTSAVATLAVTGSLGVTKALFDVTVFV